MREWLASEQGKKVVSLVGSVLLTFVVSLAAIYGYDIGVVQPQGARLSASIATQGTAINTLLNDLGIESPSGNIGAQSLGGGIVCKAGSTSCVTSKYARSIAIYSDNGSTVKFKVDGATGNTNINGGGALTVYSDGGSTYAFKVDGATGNRWVSGLESANPTTARLMALSDGGVITPTQSYHDLLASGTATVTLASTANFTEGTLVTLINASSGTVVIQDSGNAVLAGNWTGGQYDVLRLRAVGARWIELGRSDN